MLEKPSASERRWEQTTIRGSRSAKKRAPCLELGGEGTDRDNRRQGGVEIGGRVEVRRERGGKAEREVISAGVFGSQVPSAATSGGQETVLADDDRREATPEAHRDLLSSLDELECGGDGALVGKRLGGDDGLVARARGLARGRRRGRGGSGLGVGVGVGVGAGARRFGCGLFVSWTTAA